MNLLLLIQHPKLSLRHKNALQQNKVMVRAKITISKWNSIQVNPPPPNPSERNERKTNKYREQIHTADVGMTFPRALEGTYLSTAAALKTMYTLCAARETHSGVLHNYREISQILTLARFFCFQHVDFENRLSARCLTRPAPGRAPS